MVGLIMKKIISVSYKDDTPAFFAEEFFADLKKGCRNIKNQYGNFNISLKPNDVYCFIFWTKNCSDYFIEHLSDIPSPFYIQWTIDGYGKDMEPNVPDKHEVLERFKKVSNIVGKNRIVWRYDPILMSDRYTVEYHIRAFSKMCEILKGYTNKCIISFFDEYEKIRNEINAGIMRKPTNEEIGLICGAFSKIAKENGIKIQTCSEQQYDLSQYDIYETPCVDGDYIEQEFGIKLPESVKHPKEHFRKCLCSKNTDIGSYHRCKHDCKFCYAK